MTFWNTGGKYHCVKPCVVVSPWKYQSERNETVRLREIEASIKKQSSLLWDIVFFFLFFFLSYKWRNLKNTEKLNVSSHLFTFKIMKL